MPLVTVDFTQDYEDRPVSEGQYDLRIRDAKLKDSKAGNPMIECTLDVLDADGAAPIWYYINLPYKGCDHNRLFSQNLTRFIEMFNIPHEDKNFEVNDFLGAEAKQISVGQEERDGRVSNVLRLPPLPMK
jgi:hypothetical protein